MGSRFVYTRQEAIDLWVAWSTGYGKVVGTTEAEAIGHFFICYSDKISMVGQRYARDVGHPTRPWELRLKDL